MKTMTIGLSKFGATCLKLMDQVKPRDFVVIITKRGKPIARMTPLEPATLVAVQIEETSHALRWKQRYNLRDFPRCVWYDLFAFAVPPGKRPIAPSRLSHSAFPKS
jgi:prevent-host-death family protein